MTFQEGLMALRDFGFPAGLLIALCYAGWKWGWWLLVEVIKPSAAKFIEFLQHGMETMTKLTDSSEQVVEQMKHQSDKLTSHGEQLTQHGRTLEELKGLLKR